MRIGAAYIRVSTEEQLEFSPDSQLKKIREFAAAQGIALSDDHIYREDGISGREAEHRPAFQRMIAAAKALPRPFDVILVWKFSRFARSRSDSIFYKTLLRQKLGIDVLSVSEPIGRDKTAKIYESIIEVMDEYYCDNLSEEVRRGMEERFSRGRIIAPPPYGYRAENGAYVPDGERAETVERIYLWCAAGMPTRAIAAKLNESGLRTRSGKPFEVRTVRYILENPVYLGCVRKLGEDGVYRTVSASHPPLVSQALFFACEEKLRKNAPRPYVRANAAFPLSGLIRCSACGSTLTLSSKTGRIQCCAYAKGKCTVSHSVALSEITEAVLGQLAADLSGTQIRLKVSPPAASENGERILRRERARLRRIEEAYEAGVYSLDQLVQAKQALAKKEAENTGKAAALPPPLDMCADLPAFLRLAVKTDASLANAMLKSILSEVVFSRSRGTVQLFYRDILLQ